MVSLPLAEGVENVTLSGGGSRKANLGIFDSSKEKVLADLDVGIREAQGRYQLTDDNTQGAAGAGNPVESKRLDKIMERPYASTCWKPQLKRVDAKDVSKGYTPKVDPVSGQELVLIYIKCKGAKVAGLLTDIGGNTQSQLQIGANDLVKQLQSYRDALEDMDKDSELGKFWHNIAVRNAFPPKQRTSAKDIAGMAHCLEADKWVGKAEVKEESPYPSEAIKMK